MCSMRARIDKLRHPCWSWVYRAGSSNQVTSGGWVPSCQSQKRAEIQSMEYSMPVFGKYKQKWSPLFCAQMGYYIDTMNLSSN